MKNKINFKKAIASFTTLAMISMSLVGCNSSTNSSSSTNSNSSSSSNSSSNSNDLTQETKEIVCTIFPIYDWLSEIIGDNSNIELTYLMNNGVDLHSFQPSVNDIIAIQESDLFVYVGGESDMWVDSIINTDVNTLNLMEALGDKVVAEEMVEGMQQTSHDHEDEHDHEHDDEHDHEHDDEHDHEHDDEHDHEHDEDEHDHEHDDDEHDHEHDDEHDHEHDHEHEDEHDHEHDDEHDHEHDDEHDHEHDDEHDHEHEEDEHDHEHNHDDEHVWLSLNNAKILVDKLLDEVVELSPENTDAFTTRAEDYIKDLDILDDKYSSIISSSNRDIILVADRFPLRYLVDDYDLDYFAAFSGCSAEAEVSFETIKFLTDKVNELELTSILIMEDSTEDMAQTIINNSSSGNTIEILTFNSMQSITNSDIKDGVSYIAIMEENLEDILAFALN